MFLFGLFHALVLYQRNVRLCWVLIVLVLPRNFAKLHLPTLGSFGTWVRSPPFKLSCAVFTIDHSLSTFQGNHISTHQVYHRTTR